MNARLATRLGVATALLSAATWVAAADATLNSVLYSEKESSRVTFLATARAPKAKLTGSVEVKGKQALIQIDYSRLEPALLYGGDVNAWVVWAITPDGHVQNLGVLPVRDNRSGDAHFSSSSANFAMIVTAEPFAGVRRPSDLVAFLSEPVKSTFGQNGTAPGTNLRMGTKRNVESIAGLEYKDRVPVELAQARLALDMLSRNDAATYAPQAMASAKAALAGAEDAYAGRVGQRRDIAELSSRAIDRADEAAWQTIKAMEAKQAEAQEPTRQAQLAALGMKAD
jgi:hypothetical protein